MQNLFKYGSTWCSMSLNRNICRLTSRSQWLGGTADGHWLSASRGPREIYRDGSLVVPGLAAVMWAMQKIILSSSVRCWLFLSCFSDLCGAHCLTIRSRVFSSHNWELSLLFPTCRAVCHSPRDLWLSCYSGVGTRSTELCLFYFIEFLWCESKTT